MLARRESSIVSTWFRPAAASVVFAGLWFGLAWRTPTSTHHFAPLIVSGSWGFLLQPADAVTRRLAAAGGVGVAAITVAALAAADRLLGPTLWGSRPSWRELLGFAVLGGIVTLVRGRAPDTTPTS